jgi:hypothetical protein
VAYEVKAEFRRVAALLVEIKKKTPDLTGADFAHDHGWISSEDHAAQEVAAGKGLAQQRKEHTRLENIRKKHREETQAYCTELAARIEHVLREYSKKEATATDPKYNLMRHRYTLLTDLRTNLLEWSENGTPKLTYIWGFLEPLTAEFEKFLAKA